MAQNNFPRALPLPRGFDGHHPELWKDFDYKLKAYLNMQEPEFSNYMNTAAASLVPVTDERLLLERDGERILDEMGHQDATAT